MTISIWRYSHLALAVSSFFLLTLLAGTGIILAFEPITQKMPSYRVDGADELTLAQTLPVLREAYPGISELSVDANQFVRIKATGGDGKNLDAYVNPLNAQILGLPQKTSDFFESVKSLHRSLFLHETGRAIVGIASFLLLLITGSGIALIIQRQRSLKRFFNRIVRNNFAQYYHVTLGRLSLLPILIIAISGTYLSLARFDFFDTAKQPLKVDFEQITATPERKLADIPIFKKTRLADAQSIEFPFSEDVEDYYTLKLTDGEVAVNQLTGDILDDIKYPKAVVYTNLSLDLHTGRTHIAWALVLAIAAANILFFIYSGFAITIKRTAGRADNKFKADECSYIILVGSENGSTYRFAGWVHQQLLAQGKKSFITDLNNYTVFPKAEHLIVMAATYGIGQAPANADKFRSLVEKHPQTGPVHYSVLGFGSHAYPDFCRFAFEVNHLLSRQAWSKSLIDIHAINDRSPQEFELWTEAWSQQSGLTLAGLTDSQLAEKHKLNTFTVSLNSASYTSSYNPGQAFSVAFKKPRRQKVTSGDLLAIYPANDHRERLYSIGLVDGKVQLSVRLHEQGLGSGFLHRLTPGEKVRAHIVNNDHFHFPAHASEVVMISNGTGIAPFLGMIDQNKRAVTCHLYCGFRDGASVNGYQRMLDDGKAAGRLTRLNMAFSREGARQHVGDLVARDADLIAHVLKHNGSIMICGSLAMQKDVMALLDAISTKKTGEGISFYQSHGQILTDCY